jgi:hypothetical protein
MTSLWTSIAICNEELVLRRRGKEKGNVLKVDECLINEGLFNFNLGMTMVLRGKEKE